MTKGEEPRGATDQCPGCAHLVEKGARDISFRREPIGCGGPVEQRIGCDPFPERAQLCDALLGWIACDDCGVDGADRDPRNPIRMEIRLRQRLVHSRLIRAKGTAALEQQRDTLEGRTVSPTARPISHDVMHGVMPSLGGHLARATLAPDIKLQFRSVSCPRTPRELGRMRLAGM